MKYKGISLFSGIGGFELGLMLAGLSPYIYLDQFVEQNPFCQKVLRKHFPTVAVCNDIKDYHPRENDAYASIVFGGFPCQDISSAGKRAGIKEGTRSGLFFELMRVVRLIRPRVIFLENVATLLSARGGMDVVLGELAQAGYDVEWTIISAADVGAVHLRERVWIVGYPQRMPPQETATLNAKPKKLDGYLMSHKDLAAWLPYAVDRSQNPMRKEQLQALGNAVVPHVAAIGWQRIGKILGVTSNAQWEAPVFGQSFAWHDSISQTFKTWQRHLFEDWQPYTASYPRQGAMREGQLYYQNLWTPTSQNWALPTPTANDNDNRRTKPTPAELEGRHGWALKSAIAGIEQGTYPNPNCPAPSSPPINNDSSLTPQEQEFNSDAIHGGRQTENAATGMDETVYNLPTPSAKPPQWKNIEVVDKDGLPPTHPNQRFYDKKTGRLVQKGVKQAIAFLPTPTTFDGTAGQVLNENTQIYRTKNGVLRKTSNQGVSGSVGLARFAQIESLPTPQGRDWKGKSGKGFIDRGGNSNLPTALDRHAIARSCVEQERARAITGNAKLNPKFVAGMMGFPLDWLDLA